MSMPVNLGTSSPNAVQTLFKAIDANDDGQLSSGEFGVFMDKLIGTLHGDAPARRQASGLAAVAETTLSTPPLFAGFDESRAESAKGTLKYDAYNVLKKYDPADPASMKKAFAELDAMHPGQYELDDQDNLLLTGTADGYIGARPAGWGFAPVRWEADTRMGEWMWSGYNSAHPGPNGEAV
jgi:hypothetical protein